MENTNSMALTPVMLARVDTLRQRGELTPALEATLREMDWAGRPALHGFGSPDGTITLTWNMQVAKLLSPDGKLHCLPCEVCGGLQWVGLEVVSIVCDDCTVEHMGL